jgi:lysophospholipase L1-like esterase
MTSGRQHSSNRLRAATAAVAAGIALAACGGSADEPQAVVTPAASSTRSAGAVYVAVGASETAGYGADDPVLEAWPTVLHQQSLPRARYVNLGIPGATAADALAKEVPAAVAAAPTVVTVWLNVNDLVRQVPPSAYEYTLGRLVHQLRRGGQTKVLVANTPPVERMPSYLACRPSPPAGAPPCQAPVQMPPPEVIKAAVRDYNAAIARVVRAEGAVLVDLHTAGQRAHKAGDDGELFGADGFHPSTLGHRAVADAFAATLRSTEGR